MTLEKETSIYQLGAIAGKFEDIEDFVATKNSIFHQPDAPSTSGRKVGDIWYDSDDGYSMYKFDGTTWVREQYGTNAISVGAVTAARLDAQDVYTNFLRVYFLSAAQAEIDSLSAITANLGSVNVGGVNNEDGVIQVLDAAGNPIGKWDNTGLTAQGVFRATNGTASCTIDSDANGAFVSAENAVTAIRMSANNDGSVGIYEVDPLPGGGESTTVLWERTGMGLYTPLGISVGFSGSGVLEHAGMHLEDDGYITFYQPRDHALLVNTYNDTNYNLIRNHNNGNISVSASGAGLYLGYENTTLINFFNGAYVFGTYYTEITNANSPVWLRVRNAVGGNGIFIQANTDGTVEVASNSANGTRYGILKRANNSNSITTYGTWTFTSSIVSSNSSGQAIVYASNNSTGNRIFIYADASSGVAGLYSYDASNTARAILVRANNSHAITAYGNWTFSNPIVNPSDIRLKEHVRNSSVNALNAINSIPMREFDWKSDGHHQAVGIIADELEKVDPGLVCGGGKDENGDVITKGIDSMYLIGYLVKAVQELSAEIDRLKGAA